jgi:hypothetical protein
VHRGRDRLRRSTVERDGEAFGRQFEIHAVLLTPRPLPGGAAL